MKNKLPKLHKKNKCRYYNKKKAECQQDKERGSKVCNAANCLYFEPVAKVKDIAPVQNENTTPKAKTEKDTTQKITKQTTTPKNENKSASIRVPRDCIHCNDKTLICQKVKSEFYNITCRPRNCKDFTPTQMPQLTPYALTYQAGTHERSNEYIRVSKNVGTAMHVGYMKSNEARRHKSRCEFYDKNLKYCEIKKRTCPGSARCNSYREKTEN